MELGLRRNNYCESYHTNPERLSGWKPNKLGIHWSLCGPIGLVTWPWGYKADQQVGENCAWKVKVDEHECRWDGADYRWTNLWGKLQYFIQKSLVTCTWSWLAISGSKPEGVSHDTLRLFCWHLLDHKVAQISRWANLVALLNCNSQIHPCAFHGLHVLLQHKCRCPHKRIQRYALRRECRGTRRAWKVQVFETKMLCGHRYTNTFTDILRAAWVPSNSRNRCVRVHMWLLELCWFGTADWQCFINHFDHNYSDPRKWVDINQGHSYPWCWCLFYTMDKDFLLGSPLYQLGLLC